MKNRITFVLSSAIANSAINRDVYREDKMRVVAQLVERWSPKPEVRGSIPFFRATKHKQSLATAETFFKASLIYHDGKTWFLTGALSF